MGRLQQHGGDLQLAPAQTRQPAGWYGRVVVVFLAAWAIHSLVVTGASIVNEPIGHTLRTSPAEVQAQTGTGFAQSLIPLQSMLPRNARIYLLWDGPNDQGLRDYAYFWASYWLYPRPVTVRSDLSALDPGSFDVLIRAVQGTQVDRPELGQYQQERVLTYPGWTITVYQVQPSHG